MIDVPRIREIVRRFPEKRVMVLGDFVADEYILGKTSRISREAPVLILKYASRQTVLGGAGNAAHNLAALGGKVLPVGAVGDDEAGREIAQQLKQCGMDTTRLLVEPDRPTTTKTRIMAGGQHTSRQQVVRIDRGEPRAAACGSEDLFLRALQEEIDSVDALIVSDYDYGVLSPRVIEAVNRMAKGGERIITVDSRYRMTSFRNVTAVTPNEPEVEEAFGIRLGEGEDSLRIYGERILKELQCASVLITRGSKGMALFEPGGKAEFIPIVGSHEIADVTGAGDTVIGVLTLALACGASFREAAHLANIGAGVVVMKRGTATVSQGELILALNGL